MWCSSLLAIVSVSSAWAQAPVLRTQDGNMVAAIGDGRSFSITCPDTGSSIVPCAGDAVTVNAGECQPVCPIACTGDSVTVGNDNNCGCSASFVAAAVADGISDADSNGFDGAWLGFAGATQDSKIWGPSGPSDRRIVELGGLGFDRFAQPQLRDLFACNFVAENGTGAVTQSAPTGVSAGTLSTGAGSAFVPCELPTLSGIGLYELQLMYRGNGIDTLVPFRGAMNGNRFNIARAYTSTTLTASGDVLVAGYGFDTTANVSCMFAAVADSGTLISVQRTPSSATNLNCGPIPSHRLEVGQGRNVAFSVTLPALYPFTGDTNGNRVVIEDTCVDGIKDGAESDVDCGGIGAAGARCARCNEGATCARDGDCIEGYLCGDNVCVMQLDSDSMPRARATAGVTQHDDDVLFASMARRLTDQSGRVVTTSTPVSNALQTGDAVLIINMMALEVNGVRRPIDFNLSAVGIHEFARIRSVSGRSVTLMSDLTNDYGITIAGRTKHLVIMQKVLEYSQLTVNSKVRAVPFNEALVGDPAAYDGGATGMILLSVRNALTLGNSGEITATSAGYRGGLCNSINDGGASGDGGQGRAGYSRGVSSSGWGVQGNCRQAGGAGGGTISMTSCQGIGSSTGGSGGGGGDNAAGGGGGHGGGGGGGEGHPSCGRRNGNPTNSRSGHGGTWGGRAGFSAIAGGGGGGDNCGGGGGGTYGTQELFPRVFFGGAGGGSGMDGCNSAHRAGNGGGIVIIRAGTIVRNGNGHVSCTGGLPYQVGGRSFEQYAVNGYNYQGNGYSSAGGAGGSIFLTVDGEIQMSENSQPLTVAGGAAGRCGNVWGRQCAGRGGFGRVRIDYVSKSGSASLGTNPAPFRSQ